MDRHDDTVEYASITSIIFQGAIHPLDQPIEGRHRDEGDCISIVVWNAFEKSLGPHGQKKRCLQLRNFALQDGTGLVS